MSEDNNKEFKPEVKREAEPVAEKKAAFKKVVTKKKSRPAPAARPAVKPEKRYSFEQWATRRGVKEHHRGGLRAFITNSKKHRTLAEWDVCFKGY
jgi:hypothetical protein